ncbi:MAG: pentapeptide repeat-containing protein [Aggregatilineales bacterium]
MAIALDWDDPENHIIRCDFTGKWTWDEFREAARQLIGFVETVPYEVYLIINGENCHGVPRGTTPFPHLNSVLRRLPANVTMIGVVTRDTFIRKVFSVARHFYEGNTTLELIDNVEDARALMTACIQQQSESVNLLAQLTSSNHDEAMHALQQLRDLDWLYDGTLSGCNLNQAQFQGADLFMGNFDSVSLLEAQLSHSNLFMINLENANLFRANLTAANLQDANLSQAMLQEATLGEAHMSPCNLTGANLRGARLWSADLQTATLVDAIFNEADLRHARLSRVSAGSASFINAKMQGVEMLFAHFNNAQFNHANLTEADMRRCNLRHASLNDVCAIGAKLEYANLGGADLCGADLRHASLTGIHFDTKTILPDGSTWSRQTDMGRFTNPRHRQFWRCKKTNMASDDSNATIPDKEAMLYKSNTETAARRSRKRRPLRRDTRTDL